MPTWTSFSTTMIENMNKINAPSASISGDGMETVSGATKHLVIILAILSVNYPQDKDFWVSLS